MRLFNFNIHTGSYNDKTETSATIALERDGGRIETGDTHGTNPYIAATFSMYTKNTAGGDFDANYNFTQDSGSLDGTSATSHHNLEGKLSAQPVGNHATDKYAGVKWGALVFSNKTFEG